MTTAIPAKYTRQTLARMKGNKLIAALPPSMTDDKLLDALKLEADFSPEQRDLESHIRIQQVKTLSNFMVPLSQHLELARALDTMMREGYVGRAPQTKASVTKLQKIYALQKAGKTFTQAADTVTSQDSTALLGVSGMGKTTTVRRFLATYPRIIFHKKMKITQVTYLHVDLSSDGNSVKALAIAIISQLDRLLPELTYHEMYLNDTSRTSTDSLILTVGRLLAIHHVGLLVADEVQNLCNSKKGAQVVMTELVTMCNMLNVPILFIGTYKAAEVLGADFRQARRSTGGGVAPWHRMPRFDPLPIDLDLGEFKGVSNALPRQSEWADFIRKLWVNQWVKKPMELTEDVLDLIYLLTQGVLDLAIKLFAIAQVRAILGGHETLSAALLEQVYATDFILLHEAIDALSKNDFRTLARYGDINPLALGEVVNNLLATAAIQRNRNRLTKPGDATFLTQVAAAAMAAGFDVESANLIAQEIEKDGKAKDMVDALRQIEAKVKPPKQSSRGKKSGGKTATSPKVVWPDFSQRPADYRQAIKLSQEQNTTVFAQLKVLGMAQNVESLVPLD